MEKFAVDLEKVLDEFEFSEGRYVNYYVFTLFIVYVILNKYQGLS